MAEGGAVATTRDPASLAARATSWNPLRCSGTALAPNVLLAAKLIALCLLVTDHQAEIAAGPSLSFILKGVFFGAAVALLFNRSVRWTAAMLGASLLGCVIVSRAFDGYATLYCGLFLVTAGSGSLRLLRGLTALAHLGAAAAFSTEAYGASVSPILVAVGVLLLVRRARPLAIWLGLLSLTAALWVGAPAMLSYALLASYLVFAPWPKEKLTVLYDGDCGFCETTRRFFERIDFDGIYDWQPFQNGAGERWGIPTAALERAAHVVVDGKIYAGFRAFHAITLYNPLTYFVLALLLLASGAVSPVAQAAIAAAAIALYFPLFWPIGEAVYQLIARNRHRLPGEKTCKIA